jgi:hypothetical protein
MEEVGTGAGRDVPCGACEGVRKKLPIHRPRARAASRNAAICKEEGRIVVVVDQVSEVGSWQGSIAMYVPRYLGVRFKGWVIIEQGDL